MKPLAFVAALSFALGVLVRDMAQDWKDEKDRDALKDQIHQCQGRGWDMVLRANAAPQCVAMMPRMDFAWPIQPNPLRLTSKEIRHAVR